VADDVLRSAAGKYVLSVDDVIQIRVPGLREYGAHTSSIRIGPSGDVPLPLLGKVHAAGLTVNSMEKQMTAKLSRLMNHPDVTIMVTEFASRPAR
jgi:protein involved in polysaccharide export with SLBB domain